LVRAQRLDHRVGTRATWLKDETRGPTGSNKDRATALCCSDAVMQSAPAIVCASTGNVAASLSVGGAAVGIPVFVFVAAGRVYAQKEALMRAMGATVVSVDGSYAEAYRLSEQVAGQLGWYSRNTADNPLCLEAKKTVAFEIWEGLGRKLPDVVYAPVGDGVTLAALGTGFSELVKCGLIDRVPEIVGVQAEGASPLVDAFLADTAWRPMSPSTIAEGIAVGEPQMGDRALEMVRATGGTMVAVSDEQILEAVSIAANQAGILVEPAGAAALAGLINGDPDRREGRVVAALMTGTGFKDHRYWPEATGIALESGPTLSAFPVDKALEIVSAAAASDMVR